jgi:hypothetical protein
MITSLIPARAGARRFVLGAQERAASFSVHGRRPAEGLSVTLVRRTGHRGSSRRGFEP